MATEQVRKLLFLHICLNAPLNRNLLPNLLCSLPLVDGEERSAAPKPKPVTRSKLLMVISPFAQTFSQPYEFIVHKYLFSQSIQRKLAPPTSEGDESGLFPAIRPQLGFLAQLKARAKDADTEGKYGIFHIQTFGLLLLAQ